LAALAKQTPTHVLIHDAARPFVSAPLIDRVIDALSSTKGAIPALPVSDTLKRGKDGEIVATIDRADLFRAQTPQGFWYVDICNAHAAAKSDQLTDDGAVAEAAGMTVSLVDGDQDNIKLTEPEDFETGEHMLGFQASTNVTRTGQGFDVHRFGEGAHVTLCGLDIPHTHGLVGHSDADVALHALTDALLGAIGAGDIGDHFPPSDPKWRGAASEKFLSFSAELIVERGGSINNVDVTIICEAPKIGPHRSAMRHRIAEILALDEAAVSVKATTTERLGFTGRGEGIAAQAIATINMRAKK
jgi:2-C-methyl-D-erythritol 4-phosphate cytidylyltransferase/2-C-methyl-D-erythritol 2,4-cyclodiphosphate synthase